MEKVKNDRMEVRVKWKYGMASGTSRLPYLGFRINMNSTEVQNPRRNSYAGLTFNSTYITLALCVYTAHARASASLPRVGLRLYLACFTPVAPVASL